MTSRGRAKTGLISKQYERKLKGIAKHINDLVQKFADQPDRMPTLARLLRAYGEGLKPWATKIGMRMIGEVNGKEREAWRSMGNAISASVQRQLYVTPVGKRARGLLAEQVELITSLPIQAGERVHRLTQQALVDSTRASEIAKEIMRTGEVAKSRAILIARTEVGRTQSSLLQARCEAIGATHYIWRTAGDGDVRPGHKAMEGTVCSWESPPGVEENGRIMHHHPGAIWNCRCWAEPVVATLQ